MLEFDLRARRGTFTLELACHLRGGSLGIFGPSGSGKSTLLACLAGLLRPDCGLIRLGDQVLFDAARGIDVPAHRRRIGMVFQDGRLFPHLSVLANLRYGRARAPRAHRQAMLERVADGLALEPLLARPVAGLSGGERQRVALGRALLSAPSLLLLDEPLASLDRAARQEIIPFLRRVPALAGVPVALVSHELAELRELAGELLLVEAGRAVGRGPFGELLREPAHRERLRGRGAPGPAYPPPELTRLELAAGA